MNKWGILTSLYIAQFLPVAFFGQTLPVFLRQQGVSLEVIGLTSFLSLPWTLKVFWSPVVDRYGWTRWGHYKAWIVAMQSLLVLAIACCAFLNLETNFSLLLGGMLLAITLAATQDIATDALAVGLLAPTERGLGNGIQGAGGYLGSIIGGGVILVLLDIWGWTRSLLAMALTTLVLLIPVLFHREGADYQIRQNLGWGVWFNFFRRRGMGRWVIVLLLYMMGVTITSTMFRPLLVDLGLSLAEIGVMNGIVAYIAGLVGSLVSGFLIQSLGRKRSLVIFGILMAMGTAAFILPTIGFDSLPVLYAISAGLHFTYGMALIALYTVMMDYSRLGTAGFDYTLQVTLVFVGSLVAGGFSGVIAEAIGYRGVFLLSVVLGFLSVMVVAIALNAPDSPNYSTQTK
ncbi:MAG: MFS transporter [Cyanophyceae cyanobacterium]